MRTLTVAMISPPPGLDDVVGFPQIDLGSDGRVPITSPALDLTVTSTRVPAPTGALAGASYDVLAVSDQIAPALVPFVVGLLVAFLAYRRRSAAPRPAFSRRSAPQAA